MKKSILIAVLVMIVAAAVAKPVSPRLASDVARCFFPASDFQIEELDGMYLLTPVGGCGFVLVAADDCVRPVLGWSPNGTFVTHNMPSHVASWLNGYRREINAMKQAGCEPSARVTAEWERFLGGRAKNGIIVEPMITTVWNQGHPFNALCPYDSTLDARSVTGCVATATAQVIKYWNHPDIGWGSHSYTHSNYGLLSAQFDTTHYRWQLMPDTLFYFSPDDEINAVAELMYHVGVAVEMNYSPNGSGAYVNSYGYVFYPSSENALKTYFKYSSLLHSVYKSDYNDSEWDSIMRVEIDAARPVLYSGHDSSGGHAFVLDGYDSNGMFHVNWGWGSHYDGYYTIDSLSPGDGGIGGNATYTFNINNSAVIGIKPAEASTDSLAVINMASATPSLGNVTGSGTYPIYTPVSITATAATGCRFVRWASGNTANPVSFLTNGDITDTAYFERISGDTLGYCYDGIRSSWRDDYSDTTAWAIRIPASMRHKGRNLTAVQMYVYEPNNDYTVSIFVGDSIDGANVLYVQQFFPQPWRGWQTIELDSVLTLNNTKPLWIAVSYVGEGYPAAQSRYSGNSDGSWYLMPHPFRPAGSEPVDGETLAWQPYDQHGEFMTWMLRAMLEPYPVTIDAHPADENSCTVYGGGDYLSGDTVTIGAIILDPRCRFRGWSTPDLHIVEDNNPYTFVALEDRELIAQCECEGVGIADVDADALQVTVSGGVITVNNESQLFDIQGRLLGNGQTFDVQTPGVYILRSGQAAKKVVVY